MTNIGIFLNSIGGTWTEMDNFVLGKKGYLWVDAIASGKLINEIMYEYDLHRSTVKHDVNYHIIIYENDSMTISVSIDINEGTMLFRHEK